MIGLRVFRYSNKDTILADVVKLPKVDEVTNEYKSRIETYGKLT